MRKFLFLILLAGINLHAQKQSCGISLSNNVTSFPVLGYPQLFVSRFHPGLDVSYEKLLNDKIRNHFLVYGSAGVYYHRLFQTAVRLHGGITYRCNFTTRFSAEASVGGGYLHSFTAYSRFKLNDQGVYEEIKQWHGRAQYLLVVSWGANFALCRDKPDGLRAGFNFKTNLQGPFAGSYVPVLPLNSFHLSVIIPLNSDNNETAE